MKTKIEESERKKLIKYRTAIFKINKDIEFIKGEIEYYQCRIVSCENNLNELEKMKIYYFKKLRDLKGGR